MRAFVVSLRGGPTDLGRFSGGRKKASRGKLVTSRSTVTTNALPGTRRRGGSKRGQKTRPTKSPPPTQPNPPDERTRLPMIRNAMLCSLALAILSGSTLFAQTKAGFSGGKGSNPQRFGNAKGSNAEAQKFGNAKGSNAEQAAELKLVAVRFEKRKFEVTVKNVGNAATKPQTLVLVIRNTRLTAQVPPIAPGQTKV